jgi:hypothetical protein
VHSIQPEAVGSVPMSRKESVRALLPAAALAAVILLGPGPANAGIAVKTGSYKGSTTQQAVSPPFRKIEFTLKKGKVILTTEPTVARGLCVSAPVFTLGGATATTKLGKDRAFTFTHIFVGSKFDKIHGMFVSPDAVEGFAIYHFLGQDLCSGGSSKVNFTAKHK